MNSKNVFVDNKNNIINIGDSVLIIKCPNLPYVGRIFTVTSIRSEYHMVAIGKDPYEEYVFFPNEIEKIHFTADDTTANIGSIIAINDHICKTCSNERCSKTEKSCWRCGAAL